jgi:putative Mg2+ transporter-C (MgtC) family protein
VLAPTGWEETLLRLAFSLLIGSIVGLEREIRNKPAGLRTHMLVSFGSALFVMVPIQTGIALAEPDPLSRVIQGIAAGVGFIGAGVVLHESQHDSGKVAVRGLTSASAIWVSSALGVAAGCGLWPLGLGGAVMALVTLNLVKRVENWI